MRKVRKQGAKGAGEEPGGGEPASRCKGSPEPGSSPAAAAPTSRRPRGRPRKKHGPGRTAGSRYAPEERRRLLEAYRDFPEIRGSSRATGCWESSYGAAVVAPAA